MQQLISPNLANVLSIQWAHEISNAHIYISISAWLKSKGLYGLAKIFEGQFLEEQSHAKMILDLLTDLGAGFSAPSIPSFGSSISDMASIAEIYLSREITTTKSLDEIREMAEDESCPVVVQAMEAMTALQQHEYKEATSFYHKAEHFGNDWTAIALWDSELEKCMS